VFVAFDPAVMIFWTFISCLIPGAILSFSILRKEEKISTFDKTFIGFALGFVLLPLIPFFAYFFAGIKYTSDLANISVIILYVLAIAAAFISKIHEDIPSASNSLISRISKLNLNSLSSMSRANQLSIILLVVIVLSFLVRLSLYSPVFHELDPYYYLYIAKQIIVDGYNPLNDKTAWFPEVEVNHRNIPSVAYTEAIWYFLYTGGSSYNNLLLADTSALYPTLAGSLMLFFIYFLVATYSKREWGVLAAALAAFAPVLVQKLSASETEATAYNFFAISFLFAMYAFALKFKDLRFAGLAALALAAVAF